ncbi:MAG TPA: 2-oxoglutarate dehydrogenase, E2 component, dihydrolipoamide succinyltransferase [Mycobacteriales bacterium]|nr:2-oxoglutarate dehydrogenase, E2 component, dihydrolipoamide succinyltransferase [Mycobacteriales bacterium]
MAVSVTMPRLGESVSEGTVTRWLKKEGERVEADEPLLEVSTDKVDTEIPSPAGGVLKSIKVGEDETVEVGSELAVIDDGAGGGTTDEQTSDAAPQQREPEPEHEPEPQAQAEPEPEPEPQAKEEPKPEPAAPPAAADSEDDDDGGSGPSYVTPLVRRLASEHNVDLADVHGTGVGGRIRKQDVLDAAGKANGKPRQQAQAPAPAARAAAPEQPSRPPVETTARGRTEKLSRLRTVIAQRMVESLAISAQLTTVVEVDLTKIARLRDRAKGEFEAREGVKLSFLPFFAVATCEALREHPAVNASIDMEAGTATYHDSVHLGIAVDTPRGLLVPVIKDASDLNLPGLARKISDLADRTRGNHITPDELGGGTFTLTNTGSRGALFDTPIINQPQVGILGTGAVVKRPVVVDDPDVGEVIAVRHMAHLALTYDHRMVDGADAARFLGTIKQRLEEGEFDAELGL